MKYCIFWLTNVSTNTSDFYCFQKIIKEIKVSLLPEVYYQIPLKK